MGFKVFSHQRSFIRASYKNGFAFVKSVQFVPSASSLDTGVCADEVVKSKRFFVIGFLITKTSWGCQSVITLLDLLSYNPAEKRSQ